MEEKITYRAICIIEDEEKIKLLADFTRAEILRLLSIKPMTETQLSQKLGLTKAAISYHLHLLEQANMIHIEKLEAEKHGILQKYYSPAAALFIVNPKKIPKEVKAYFIQEQIQFLRGVLSVLKKADNPSTVPSANMERLAVAFLNCLKMVGEKYAEKKIAEINAEAIRVKIYREALKRLMRRKEWKKAIGES